MASFFINRPIVAMVMSILMVIMGLVAMFSLPIAQFPNIVPPEILVSANYVGADAITVEESVATPIEQQVSGVDGMEYMYSLNSSSGNMSLRVTFEIGTDTNIDQVLTQMRVSQADSQLPSEVRDSGVTVQKSLASPLLVFALYSPNATLDAQFLANYATINISDPMTRVNGIASVTIYGVGDYAMRLWVDPDRLAQLAITVPEIIRAVQHQNTVNPAGQIGGEPVPPGQEFTYGVRAQGRLSTEAEFGEIVIRAKEDGSMVRLRDVARVELGAETYNVNARLDGKPAAVVALYQTPDTNALAAAKGAKALMAELATRFPDDLDYLLALDTTEAVTAGIEEIVHTFFEALVLVILVVFIFLQGWRATLIPLLAVPVSLVATFAFFPMLGFSINTLSLFGLVLAIGLVVDDAIVVVEAVEHHIENGMAPRDATLQAMSEVTGPVIATALILGAVFVPTIFIPGITGQLYQQFAATIAISVMISALVALTLSPALSALLLRPRGESRGIAGKFFSGFNRGFNRTTNGYVRLCGLLMRKMGFAVLFLAIAVVAVGWFGKNIPTGFLPEEDQGYLFVNLSLPDGASLQRTDAASRHVEEIIMNTPGVAHCTAVTGFSLLSQVMNTYSGLYFVSLENWDKRKTPETQYDSIINHLNQALANIPQGIAFAFSPPAIPGVGSSGGVSFVLQDRSGADVAFLAEQLNTYIEAANKRPELARVMTTFQPAVPQVFVEVDRDIVMKEGIDIADVYGTLQTFMGGYFINYFNRFGRQWKVFAQAEGDYRTEAENVGRFFVRNRHGEMAPMASLVTTESTYGPDFTMRYNLYRSAQINANAAPGYSSAQAMRAMEEVFEQTMPREMGYAYIGMSYQEKQAQEGIPPAAIFAFSLLVVFLILAAQYESWTLPFSVLLSTPIAVFGALAAIFLRDMVNNVYAQIGLVMLIGLAAKNAILIVEFARIEYHKGKRVYDAALTGARLRLRPILMTSFAFIMGCLPLYFASGSGAIARQTLGTTVIGGMVAASLFAIFIIPVGFYFVERFGERKRDRLQTKVGAEGHPSQPDKS